MNHEPDKSVFDFTRKVESVIENTTSKNNTFLKNLKFASFLAIGGLSIGAGLGLSNVFLEDYKIQKISEAKINEKITLEQDRYAYDLLMKNKDSIISNYEGQLNIYDNAYQNIVKGISIGVLDINSLTKVRTYYQDYRKDIHNWINFVDRSTTSFEKFRSLDKESRNFLTEAITDYQNGNLNRNAELEKLMMEMMGEPDANAVNALRNELRNKMIHDLAAIMNNENPLTTVKKLKK